MKIRHLFFPIVFLAASGLVHAQSPGTLSDRGDPVKPTAPMQEVLDALKSLNGKPIETLGPEEARKQPTPADAVKKVLREQGKSTAPKDDLAVKHMNIPGPVGEIPIHVYTPQGKGPFPVMVYFHGGGFVIATTKTYEASVRALAKKANAIMVAVDYHRAPEHKFPAAPNDAYAAYTWVLQNAKEINGDPNKVAVGGESAGGNLATVVSMMARDKNAQMPVHQLLVYPVVNSNMDNPSYQMHADSKPLNKPMMQWFFKHYLVKEADAKNPYAVPMNAESFKGLPPATIIAAEIDPLLSEGKEYAERLRKAGVPVTYRGFEGVTHEFFGMDAVVPAAQDAQQMAANALKQAFSKQQSDAKQ